MNHEDFEDALVEVCTKKIGADCIISRDNELIKVCSRIKVMKPEELMAKLS